jgi:hypothetical protein
MEPAQLPKNHLLILAATLLLAPLVTVTISLAIYNLSGDKYLDRSRPGYMPDQSEQTDAAAGTPAFSDSGPIDREALDGYLQQFDSLTKNLHPEEPFFSDRSLSDEALDLDPTAFSPDTDN